MRAVVIGSGAWGTAIAVHLCRVRHTVTLWFRDPEKAEAARSTGCNPTFPAAKLPAQLQLTGDPSCVKDAQMIVIACPSPHLRSVCRKIAPHVPQDVLLVSAVKGLESGTLLRMSEVIADELKQDVVALTGPSHAEEVAAGIPTACLAACSDKQKAEAVQAAFTSDTFRIYTSPDIIGAELGGAFKNIIALCAGVTDGMGFGDNTKAMLMTRGLTEMARLGISMGASKDTFAGLAGIGDLIVTCTSMHSRNRRAGILIGKGHTAEDAMAQIGSVVEGYYAARSVYELCCRQGVEMPILKCAYTVLYEKTNLQDAIEVLLHRIPKPESEDAGWQ